jgi:hypothetical protein
MNHTTTTQGNIVPEYPNTITYQRRNWEVLGFYYDAAYQPIEVQLRSLDHRRELRIISHKQVMERYFLESNS